MKKIGILGLSLALAAGVAMAAGEGPKGEGHKGEGGHHRFKKADTDGDGKLSLAEFKAMVQKGDAEKKFENADANKDGFLTPEELKAAHGRKPAKDGNGGGDAKAQ